MKDSKYYLKCVSCKSVTSNFRAWFEQNQVCLECGSKHSEVWYNNDYKDFPSVLQGNPNSFWHYFKYLPLCNSDNIVSCHEGNVMLQRWAFLEKFAREKYGLDIKVQVYRNDLNGGTGTFKDVAASLAASIFKENEIKQYCVASTGNTATAYARYLAIAGVNCSVFIPNNALKASEAAISAFGQQVLRVNGDYAKAKQIAAEYSQKHKILISIGNIDPIRIEAKKTMVFEWLRQIEGMPDVYIQAIAGGTGPIAIDKGVREIKSVYPDIQNPRFIMVQPDGCDPMVQAWENAQELGFPDGFENDYPIIDNPQTAIPTLANGNPATFPIISKLVKESGGAFVRMKEDKLSDFGKLIAFESKVILGPASAVCMAGFFQALGNGLINNGETVLVNTGEGVNRAPEFVDQMIYTAKNISSANDCNPHKISDYRKQLWDAVLD